MEGLQEFPYPIGGLQEFPHPVEGLQEFPHPVQEFRHCRKEARTRR